MSNPITRALARRYIGRTFKMAEPKVQLPEGFHCDELSVACDRCYLNYRLLCKANKGELRLALVKAWAEQDRLRVAMTPKKSECICNSVSAAADCKRNCELRNEA